MRLGSTASADPNLRRHRVQAVEDIRAVDPVAIGDRVRFLDTLDGSGMIVELLPRKSKLARLSAGRKPLEQVIVANLDQVVAVMSAANPDPKWNLLDRYLVSSESLGLPALICITKIDLLNGRAGELEAVLADYRRIGYAVVVTSAQSGMGLDELGAALQNRFSALIGKSGVGKTSLLNALEPDLGLPRQPGEHGYR